MGKEFPLPMLLGFCPLHQSISVVFFRKYTGQTFLAYVNQIRMEHFHTDLLETDKNITFLLDKNGITNYKGFLRI